MLCVYDVLLTFGRYRMVGVGGIVKQAREKEMLLQKKLGR
jgi:hypothetical protein